MSALSKTFKSSDTFPTAAAFNEALQSIPRLTVIDLARVSLESEHVKFIADFLLHSTTLVALKLRGNQLSP
jgi:Ran GTPase-activating protein (RanGAP) involved in mRNA processing and transport